MRKNSSEKRLNSKKLKCWKTVEKQLKKWEKCKNKIGKIKKFKKWLKNNELYLYIWHIANVWKFNTGKIKALTIIFLFIYFLQVRLDWKVSCDDVTNKLEENK